MKSVVLCGSKRFKPEMREFAHKLREMGVLVYEPYLHTPQGDWEALSADYKKYVALGLTHDHFNKIRLADVVFIFNQGGYAGVSTTLEIGYSVACGKPVYALCGDEELSRFVLVREVLATPEELCKRL